MDNPFPFLIANTILHAGCHQSVAEKVYHALCELPERDCIVLWMRLQGRSYSDIGALTELNKGSVWKIINGPVKRSIYSVIERSTMIPATAMVS